MIGTSHNDVEFQVQGITLHVPAHLLTPAIKASLNSEKIEPRESRQLAGVAEDGDRLLELGGGLGYVSTFVSKCVRLEQAVVVEANPMIVPVIQQTHRLNGVRATVLNGVALSPRSVLWRKRDQDGALPFYIRRGIWGSSLRREPGTRAIERVAAIDVVDLVAKHRPTLLVCGIDAGEADILDGIDLTSVRVARLQVHKRKTGLHAIRQLFRTMDGHGLCYDPDYSCGETVTFVRPEPAAS